MTKHMDKLAPKIIIVCPLTVYNHFIIVGFVSWLNISVGCARGLYRYNLRIPLLT